MNNRPLQQFRDQLYQALPQRADALLDLLDALTVADPVESPVALSEEVPFRRGFSTIYDVLEIGEGELPEANLKALVLASQPEDGETIAGYVICAVDATPNPRPEAETLADRGMLKSNQAQQATIGHKYSWVVRLIKEGSSWVAPLMVERIPTSSTDSEIAKAQIKELDAQSTQPQVVAADSFYGNPGFLEVFSETTHTHGLVRLKSNLNLYENPEPKKPHTRGRPKVHGAVFKMNQPQRAPDREMLVVLLGVSILLQAWHGLHLRKLPQLVGMLLRVQFLKEDGTPRYKTPIFLFWTEPLTVCLSDLCRMYLSRFAIEHFFRFAKQKLGLNTARSTNPFFIQHWMWLVALAYWQLLLMEHQVGDHRPAWHRRSPRHEGYDLTPGQVKRGALPFLLGLGTPAKPPKPSGKGVGRARGYCPNRKKRHPVIRKSQKWGKKTPKRAIATV